MSVFFLWGAGDVEKGHLSIRRQRQRGIGDSSHLGCKVIGRELLTTSNRPLNDSSALAILEQLAGA